MGVFDSVIYPDNINRANRVTQLLSDCDNLAFSLTQGKEKIDDLLAQANTAIQEAYQGKVPVDLPNVPVTLVPDDKVGEWLSIVNNILVPVVTMPAVTTALRNMWRASLAADGRIGEAAFAEFLGFPKWVRFGSIAGGVFAATAATLAVEALIDTISGAVQRDELQKAIHDMIPPRVTLKQSSMIAERVQQTLSAVIMSFTVVKAAGLDKSALDGIAQKLVDQNQVDVAAITVEAAAQALAAYDKARDAWTAEDN